MLGNEPKALLFRLDNRKVCTRHPSPLAHLQPLQASTLPAVDPRGCSVDPRGCCIRATLGRTPSSRPRSDRPPSGRLRPTEIGCRGRLTCSPSRRRASGDTGLGLSEPRAALGPLVPLAQSGGCRFGERPDVSPEENDEAPGHPSTTLGLSRGAHYISATPRPWRNW